MGRLKLESWSCRWPCSARGPSSPSFGIHHRSPLPHPATAGWDPATCLAGVLRPTPPSRLTPARGYCIAACSSRACLPGWGRAGAGQRSRGHVYLQQAGVLRPDRFPAIRARTLTLVECASAVLSVRQMFAAAFRIKFWASFFKRLLFHFASG